VRNAYKPLAEKTDGKSLLARPRYRWVDYINICFKEIECEGVD
jgi:hypothetical protein